MLYLSCMQGKNSGKIYDIYIYIDSASSCINIFVYVCKSKQYFFFIIVFLFYLNRIINNITSLTEC